MVKTKTVYQYDKDGYYTGPEIAFESPLEPGVYHIPASCTEMEPPESDENCRVRWTDIGWVQEEIPEPEPDPEPEPPTLEERKAQKEDMANRTCEATIYAGVDAELSAGIQHFALTPNDQTNIDSMFAAVTLGATEYPYHADGEKCAMYSAADILALYVAYKSFVTYQTTYCNFLKIWINREEDRATLENITYGAELPEDLAAEMQTILAAAQTQIQAVASKLIQAAGERA